MEKMVDMKRSKADMKEANTPISLGKEEYPYGLRIRLEKDDLEKLGMTKKLPAVGDEVMVEAMCKVISVSENASENHDSSSVEYQIMHISIEPHETKSSLKAMRNAPPMKKTVMG